MYQSYFNQFLNNIPYIDAKLHFQKIYILLIKNKWITNIHSRNRGHLLRSQYNCIITTYKTINKDNSMFDCRIEGLENKSPDIVIFDRNLNLSKNLRIITNKIPGRKLYIVTTSNNKIRFSILKKKVLT